MSKLTLLGIIWAPTDPRLHVAVPENSEDTESLPSREGSTTRRKEEDREKQNVERDEDNSYDTELGEDDLTYTNGLGLMNNDATR